MENPKETKEGQDKDIIGTDIASLARDVVDMFDQANNFDKRIENLGTRGHILKDAIADLRFKLNEGGQVTMLRGNQVDEHVTKLIPFKRVMEELPY